MKVVHEQRLTKRGEMQTEKETRFLTSGHVHGLFG